MIRTPLAVGDLASGALRRLDPERAHALTVRLMASGAGPRARVARDPRLESSLGDLKFPNPVGLAAGFDKHAECPDAMLDLGFGFVEIGSITPNPQPGNDRPRVFRLFEDRAVINRYGFNSEGLGAVAARLAERQRRGGRGPRGIVGANLGANKESADRIADYCEGVRRLAGLVDFYTVNISSPNTPGLRTLQRASALDGLLSRVIAERDRLAQRAPVFLKIAPDLTDSEKADIAESARAHRIDALVVSNTTIVRSGLKSRFAAEAGGLSGAPLFAPSTALLREFHLLFGGKVPLIGVGGVASARDAYDKILAGASLIELYTAMIYEGPSLPSRILRELPALLDADGFKSIAEAVGAAAR